MEQPRLELDGIIVKTEYFKGCIESLLKVLQPSYYCLNLIIKVLLHGPDGSGKRLLARTAARNLNMNFIEERVADLFNENVIGTEKKVRAAIATAASSAPCLIYFTGYELFCRLDPPDLDHIEHCIAESLDELTSNGNTQPLVFVGATNNFQQVYHSALSNIFQHDISIKSATKDQARDIINLIKQEAELKSQPASLLDVHTTNVEYYLGNLINIIARTEIEFQQSLLTAGQEEKSAKIENEGTRWADVGGLSQVKAEIIDTIQLSIDFPQLKKSGLRRTGVLLHGPPGTGKTLLAKAVATECGLHFINVKGPELLNEYVGQSEDNVRKLFSRAREASPSVIFFDELDSLAPNRGQAGDSGGVMDRMVSQILAEMDGVGKSNSVFVIGATNRVDLVDPSLLRPGRFDKVLEVPVPTSRESRMQILEALTRRFKLSSDVDLAQIESLARKDMSGADFQGLCARALQRTFDRCVEQVESGQLREDEIEIITSMNDFLQSIES